MNLSYRISLSIVCGFLLLGRSDARGAPPGPVISRPQIEADWLRQDELRPFGAPAAQPPAGVSPQDDAAGAVDGVKDGKWGFHTENEPGPWWQVDLGAPVAIGSVVLYNRCDAADRSTRLVVLVSDDAKAFKQVYQHDGTAFNGYTDKKPLAVDMKGVTARYVRLQLPEKNYFHLDEVEIYAPSGKENVALGKQATQSSTSQWSSPHRAGKGAGRAIPSGRTGKVIELGMNLARSLAREGVDVAPEVRVLDRVADQLSKQPGTAAPADAERNLYFESRWAIRRLAMKNPLLDFDTILFVKRAPGRFPHMSDQFYGWWSRPGGGVQGFKSESPSLTCLTTNWPEGNFLRPDLSLDGKKILFAYCKYYPNVADVQDKAAKTTLPEDAFYHVFEMGLDGKTVRQLTHGRYDDFDARYLPSGDVVFLSTRKGTFVQTTTANSAATTKADLPDSYVRCGGDRYRPVPVFTLHVMNSLGGALRPISAFENFEWTPSVANDGRILYTRWDYIDRFNGHFFSLWSTNPDGTNPQLVYGNYTTRPQVKFEARAIPNSRKIVCTAGAHHSNVGGSLILLDRSRGTEEGDPIVRLTPEVPFPETESWANAYYANPFPLSEEHYLVAWSDRKLPPHGRFDDTGQNPVNATGLYLYDAFGNLTLLYRDPDISCESPIPVRSRPSPPVYAEDVKWDGPQEGALVLQDVYRGLGGVARGSILRLRIVAVPPKVQPNMNTPSIGVSSEDPGKYVLGTVPVEADGSAYFRIPSGVPVFFQAVDANGLAVQTMRSLTYVQPGQTLGCVGCHELRESAPSGGRSMMAARRPPSGLTPGPEGSWPLRFDRLVQPVMDKSCTSCHRPGSGNEKASGLDLAGGAYDNLLRFANNDIRNLVFERDRSITGDCPARKSRLMSVLMEAKGHNGVRLDRDSRERLATWLDVYAQRQGHFSDQQEGELRELRRKYAALLSEAR
ncbi:MAG: discoidin domain-containing protein [Planctomycetota bacterium]|nr:discoidin domain-containing protein [Planctomycetota bacterium]